jgi:hypothetical protein
LTFIKTLLGILATTTSSVTAAEHRYFLPFPYGILGIFASHLRSASPVPYQSPDIGLALLMPCAVRNKVKNLLTVHSALAVRKQKEDVYIVISPEPGPGQADNRGVFDRLRKLSHVEVYDLESAGARLAEYVTQHRVRPVVPNAHTA